MSAPGSAPGPGYGPSYGPPGYPAAYPPNSRDSVGLPSPVAIEFVPGTPFAVAIVGVPPMTSGPAAASLVVGTGSVLVSLVVGCFGVIGSSQGWGPMVAGASAVLAGLAAVAAVGLGRTGLRQIRRVPAGHVNGRGMAITGIITGVLGLLLTVGLMVVALATAY